MLQARGGRLLGSIPACAGEPQLRRRRFGALAVYPRVCGGTPPSSKSQLLARGLSPRVRGNHQPVARLPSNERSIPACAGEPPRREFVPHAVKVYPRVCGGTLTNCCHCKPARGLSPRVRGNRRAPAHADAGFGSIPACAGEPPSRGITWRRAWVYPRVCGGTAERRGQLHILRGLSPRVRGNRGGHRPGELQAGSIPACAGEPSGRYAILPAGGVYPRVCGGTGVAVAHGPLRQGLSPRVRGNLIAVHIRLVKHRSIPACAGEPQDLELVVGW